VNETQSSFASGALKSKARFSSVTTERKDIIGVHMKKIILATVLAGLCSTAALAADLGARTYTKAPAMVEAAYNWTGFYIGGDIGAASLSHNFTSNFTQDSSTLGNNLQQNSFSSTSFIGGVHAGYNWQFAPNLVAGVEGDWQWVRSSHSFCRQTDIQSIACIDDDLEGNARGFGTVSGRLNSIATARARLGWTIDRVMFYGTGGAAFANVKSSLGLSCLADGCGVNGVKFAASSNTSAHVTGWVAGAGIEWMIAHDWILRAEYQHIDFSDVSARFSPDCGGCALTSSQNLRLDVVRTGLSYKFGGPVLAKY
jgi:outer membrane immunogenic protein